MKKREKVSKRSIKRACRLEDLAGRLKLPTDVLSGSMVIYWYGKSCVKLENYIGLLDYSDTCVKLWSKGGKLKIEGVHLKISYCSDVEVCIMGKITKIQYIE